LDFGSRISGPTQFFVFLSSLYFVLQYVWTGQWYGVASRSIILKTGFLLLIMVTGAIWGNVIVGQYFFASAFF
jgi:3-vinyl bacteriochlorophyllide hydratase